MKGPWHAKNHGDPSIPSSHIAEQRMLQLDWLVDTSKL